MRSHQPCCLAICKCIVMLLSLTFSKTDIFAQEQSKGVSISCIVRDAITQEPIDGVVVSINDRETGVTARGGKITIFHKPQIYK